MYLMFTCIGILSNSEYPRCTHSSQCQGKSLSDIVQEGSSLQAQSLNISDRVHVNTATEL